MPTNIATHTFMKGMISDTGINLKNNESYDYAENLRHTNDYTETIGSLTNIKGFEQFTSAGEFDSRLVVIRHVTIRDKLYLLCTSRQSAAGQDSIYRMDIDAEDKVLSNLTLLYGGGALGFDLAKTTDCVGIYESSDNIKIYFSTPGANLKVTNVSTYVTTDGLAYNGSTNDWIDSSRFDMITSSVLSTLAFEETTVGSLQSGRVQYAYNLTKTKLQESYISPLSPMINLYSSTITNPTVNIKGDYTTINTGKGVRLSVQLDSDDVAYYDKVRVYRMYYSDYGQIPQITIIGDFQINNNLSIIDQGQTGLGELTAEEFSIMTGLYSVKTIDVKDNRLFAANVEESVFNIDYDARSYRFNNADETRIYSSYGSYSTPEYIIDGTNPTNNTIGYTSWLDIPKETNCINPYNDLDNDYNAAYMYIYQKDGATVGGEGPKVKYSFTSQDSGNLPLLDYPSTLNSGRTYNAGDDYTNNDIVTNSMSFQRDEIYRVGLVFINSYGQESNTKWIGDIRMPTTIDNGHEYITTVSSGYVATSIIGLDITLKEVPDGAIGWRVVRVRRAKSDRSVITSGITTAIMAIGTYDIKYVYPTFNSSFATSLGDTTFSDTKLSFTSVEECFQQSSDIKINDKLDIIGVYSTYKIYTEFGSTTNLQLYGNHKNSIKYTNLEIFDKIDVTADSMFDITDKYYSIDDTSSISSTYSEYTPTYEFTDTTFKNVATGDNAEGYGYYLGGRNSVLYCADADFGALSSELSTMYETTTATPESNGYWCGYALIKRNNISRYNGSDFISREHNEYIPCSSIIPIGTLNSAVFGGDTYITMFDYLYTMNIQNWMAGSYETSVSIIAPMESVINTSLRSDDHYANSYNLSNIWLQREHAGIYPWSSTEFVQESDLYLYNTIYSQEQNVDFSYGLNDQEVNSIYDSRIIYSDKKVYDEQSDNWLKFRVNNFLDVESIYGQIECVRNFRNDLHFWQEDAFGITPVNERSLLTDNNPGALSLGVANVLSRYGYITKDYGCKDLLSVLNTNAALYWVDRHRKSIIKYDGSTLGDLSKVKGVKTLTKTLMDSNTSTTPFTYMSAYNKDYNEVLLKLTSDSALLFNEYFDVFSSVMTFTPDYVFSTKGLVCTARNAHIYGHDKTTEYSNFVHGTNRTHRDSKLVITNSDNIAYTKVYDNTLFYTFSKNSSDNIVNLDTFYSVEYTNDYQTTGVVPLVLGTNLVRKERGYSTYIPRNIVTTNGTTTVDITDSSNQSTSRVFKERMRDKYIQAEFVYNNSDYLFSIPEIQFIYRFSKPNVS